MHGPSPSIMILDADIVRHRTRSRMAASAMTTRPPTSRSILSRCPTSPARNGARSVSLLAAATTHAHPHAGRTTPAARWTQAPRTRPTRRLRRLLPRPARRAQEMPSIPASAVVAARAPPAARRHLSWPDCIPQWVHWRSSALDSHTCCKSPSHTGRGPARA